jgi:hypothetical protein
VRRRLFLAALAAACLASGAGAIAAAIAPERPRADVFVAPGGSDASDCRSKRTACATLDRAYRAARGGEIVEVAAGEYPEQVIVADQAKKSRRHVVIRPAPGARVTVRGLILGSTEGDGPRHLTIERLRTSFASPNVQLPAVALPGTRDVTLRDIDAGNFTLWGVKNLRVDGGDWGPCHTGPGVPCTNSRIDSGGPGYETDRVTVDGALFHDYRFSPACHEEGADCHFECMYVNGSSNVTIRRSTLRDCALFDIFVTISGPDAARVGHRNLRIVGNVLDTPWDEAPHGASRRRASAVSLSWCQNSPLSYRNVLIAFNSFQSGTSVVIDDPSGQCRFENARLIGNLLAWDGCDARWTYGYNVWSTALRRGRCARSDRTMGDRLPYARHASGADLDLGLRDGRTPADAFVPQTAAPCPQRDIDGDARPRRGPCDAGADERDERTAG